ncbi:MAG: tetratricopeptide repeat protein [Chloroflexota bacterium]
MKTRQLDERSMIRIYLLNRFSIMVGQQDVTEAIHSSRIIRHIIILLALNSQHSLHREQLVEYLWPEERCDVQVKFNRLFQHLHRARTLLKSDKPLSLLSIHNEVVILARPDALFVDVVAFREAATTAQRTQIPEDYHIALDLYRGGLLPDEPIDWVHFEREQLSMQYQSLLYEAAHLQLAREHITEAIDLFYRHIASDPIHEESYCELFKLHARLGQQRETQQLYKRLQEALQREFDDHTPDEETQQLYQHIMDGQIEARPIPIAPRRAQHNLPHPLTSFIGRNHELATLPSLLRETRLVTLTGPGGCGKTRLALEMAPNLMSQFPDGIWWIDVAAITEAPLVAQSIALILGLREKSDTTLIETIIDYLRTRRVLLVLDNCEHVHHTCAALTEELLQQCPQLQVLTTSRICLGVDGEFVCPLLPLSLPPTTQSLSLDEAKESDAIQLFCARARMVDPSFRMTADNVAIISTICMRLDGLPLAIQLAAARMRVLSVEQIEAKLDNRFGFLINSQRSTRPQHTTLRETVEWSYSLLQRPERQLFNRLAVFAGGWSIEAAESVGAGKDIDVCQIHDLLFGLVDNSLIVVEATISGPKRYRMLETLHEYAWERLNASNMHFEAQQRHAHYYVALAQEAEEALHKPQRDEWIRRLEWEHDNIRVALCWLLDHDSANAAILGASLWEFWYLRGHLSEGRHWLEAILTRNTLPILLRAKALSGVGVLTSEQGNYEQAQHYYDESIQLYRALNNHGEVARILSRMGAIANRQENYVWATTLYHESLQLKQNVGDTLGVAATLNNLGITAHEQKKYHESEAFLQQSLCMYQQLEDPWWQAVVLSNLGDVALSQENTNKAKQYFTTSLRVRQATGSFWDDVWCIEGLASVAALEGVPERAVRLWGAAAHLRKIFARPLSLQDRIRNEQRIENTRSHISEPRFQQVWESGQALSLSQAIMYALDEQESHHFSTLEIHKSVYPLQ